MLVMHAHGGLGIDADGIHYAVVAAGVLGLVALLTPRFLAEPDQPRDAHAHATGLAAQRLTLPLGVVSSVAAAAVHAAVAPEHLRESGWFGVFFIGAALLQLAWAALVSVRGSRSLLAAGASGNLALIGLWAVTRTLGLPFGLLPGPEAVGPWDLACAGWELVVVCACIWILRLRDPLPRRLLDWRHWHPALPTYVAATVLLLVALSRAR
jgi:hypothetical protein